MGRLLLGLLLSLPLALGQTSAGRITGIIRDASGAVIPNATVSARNSETGIVTPAASNGEGLYVLYPLPPGTYAISVDAPGFRAERIEGVMVDLEAVLSRDVRLEVMAAQRETVVVTATSPVVSESPSVQSTMVTEQIQTLPLNSRDFNQLVILAAGAVENSYAGHDFGSVAVNGNRAYGNDYMLDGTPNTNPFVRNSATGISVDTIREFKVTSGVAAAEYGQAGTQVSIVTRSGSNALHGSAFEYHRGTTWQASNPFNPGVILPFHNDQFGGSIGGPVIRNHTFFFFNYEGGRETQGNPIVVTTPLAAFWNGDFSSLLARNITVRDPLGTGRPPFAGNLIPATRINPVALALRPYWGDPNRPGLSANLVSNSSLASNADQFTVRMDHTLPRNQYVSFRFTQSSSNGFSPSVTGNASGTSQPNHNENASLGWTAPITAAMVNELRLGFADLHYQNGYLPNGLPTTASIGMQGFAPINSSVQPVPKITFAGNDAFTMLNYGPNISYGEASTNQASKTTNAADTFTYVRGSHTFKIGIEYRHEVLPALLQPGSSGLITFNGTTGATSSGYSFGDFLLGLPATSQQVPPIASITLRQNQFASYAQDDWRVLSRLTLSIGLRYELLFNPVEDKNRLAMFDPALGAIVVASDNGVLPVSQYSPVIVADLSDGKGNWKFPLVSDKQAGYPARSLLDTQYGNWGPRFGFAYHLSSGPHQFVMRGGYGIFYNRYPVQNLQQVIAINPPFAGTFNFTQAITGGVPAITLQNPYAGSAAASVSPGGLVRNWDLPSNQQWNLTMERDLGWGTTLSLGYIGNKGTHLFRAVNVNGVYIDPATGAQVRDYQSSFGTVAISERTTDATSIYHSMQTVVRRRLNRGVLFEFNWTWAKGLDDVGTALNVSALDVENLGRDRADSDYVRRHTVHLNATWEMPVGRGQALLSNAPRWLDLIAGGWRLSGIWSRYSGMRFTPAINNTGLANTRPEYVYGMQANLPADQRSVSRWFNAAAFTPPPVACGPAGNQACFGNAGRNILVGPGIDVVDGSLSKSFPVWGERRRLTLRLELFNAFNHPNYALPDGNISDVNTVGSITSLVKDMREAQFAVRFDF
jgi:hypothetical protein